MKSDVTQVAPDRRRIAMAGAHASEPPWPGRWTSRVNVLTLDLALDSLGMS